MSDTGCWGDKIIITLRSDGERRHKCWCKHYRAEDKFCTERVCRCTGSAFCEDYTSTTKETKPPFKNPHIEWVKGQGTGVAPVLPKEKIKYDEYYRRASYGDKLLHRTILFKTTPFTFRIGVVVEESLHSFTVEYNGKKVPYDKKAAYRSGSVYIFTEVELPGDNKIE